MLPIVTGPAIFSQLRVAGAFKPIDCSFCDHSIIDTYFLNCLCRCYDKNLPRVEPAAPSGLELDNRSGRPSSISIGHGVCGLMIDESLFNALAPHAVVPFTYQGFCESIDHYNAHHAEKVFRMGSYQDRLSELAAFLGIASHETNNFVASREYLACGDNLEVDGVLYCKPCSASDYNYDTHKCSVSMLAGDQSYME